ncbi:hypothetical protein ACFQ1M_17020 [Sungkyunkwania multivorans]|uniref:Uncharacterized protein n=1 Tax=Sungkyunkwania multivorans TaxID=1173618 RepID=A0ABW3D237_9FLAO|nr:hypothetical protein [Algibacter luteus]WJJ96457.1 hypothetical protein O5O44_14675 [Algibacter luteus]
MNGQTEMLIGQISGRTVARENFDEDGVLLNKQTFEAGKIIEKKGYYQIEVVTELFDEEKKPTEKYTTTYRCKPDETSIMVMAFPFAKPNSKETEINSSTKNFTKLYDLVNLKDIELEMSFDSGLLNFFGSRSLIRIYDRQLNTDKANIQIESKINIKAYALGIRIKQLNYTVIEELNNNNLLIFQKFTEVDGSYFTMTYN